MSDPQPAPDLETLKAATADMIAELRASGGVPGLEIGDQAPDFALPDQNGQIVNLRQRLDRESVVLSFYRGAWCPCCNLELRALQTALPRLDVLGASLIAISPQRPDDALTLAECEELAFDFLSDPDQAVIRAYQLQFELSDALKAIYPLLGMNFTELNADGSWHLPVPATFVLDTTGVVRARRVDPDCTRRMDVDEILGASPAPVQASARKIGRPRRGPCTTARSDMVRPRSRFRHLPRRPSAGLQVCQNEGSRGWVVTGGIRYAYPRHRHDPCGQLRT